MAAALGGLRMTAVLQITSAAPATAAGSSVGLFAWGDDLYGELGEGVISVFNDKPVVVSLPSGVTPKAVTGGGAFHHAIGSDGHCMAGD
jgi:hypothetical protein